MMIYSFNYLTLLYLLKSIGVNVSGAVVIVKYGKIFRGVKAMLAQEYPLKSIIIISNKKIK